VKVATNQQWSVDRTVVEAGDQILHTVFLLSMVKQEGSMHMNLTGIIITILETITLCKMHQLGITLTKYLTQMAMVVKGCGISLPQFIHQTSLGGQVVLGMLMAPGLGIQVTKVLTDNSLKLALQVLPTCCRQQKEERIQWE
jgi:hypothetical protein